MINYHKIKNKKWDKIIIPSKQKLDIYRRLLLKLLLHGHKDISDKICNYIDEFELKDLIYEYNEIHFYNWLNNDVILRNKLGKNMVQYYELQNDEEKNKFMEENINNCENIYSINNYEILSNSLGLTWKDKDYYRRSKSLTECFNSQWWKTTEKISNINWNHSHFIISVDIEIKISKNEINDNNILSEYLENHELFRNPTIKERIIIIEYLLEYDDIYGDIVLITPKLLKKILKKELYFDDY